MGRLICLGTGAALNPERAQTSVALRLSDEETILFDASGGTTLLGRLRSAGIPLGGTRHLFVSHGHFDHVGGLAPLLTCMVSLPEAHLTVHALPGTLGAKERARQAYASGHSAAGEAGEIALAAGTMRLVLTYIRASRFAGPDTLAKEAEAAFGSPVEVARDLDAFGF